MAWLADRVCLWRTSLGLVLAGSCRTCRVSIPWVGLGRSLEGGLMLVLVLARVSGLRCGFVLEPVLGSGLVLGFGAEREL